MRADPPRTTHLMEVPAADSVTSKVLVIAGAGSGIGLAAARRVACGQRDMERHIEAFRAIDCRAAGLTIWTSQRETRPS